MPDIIQSLKTWFLGKGNSALLYGFSDWLPPLAAQMQETRGLRSWKLNLQLRETRTETRLRI